jgi:hypothetical protein
MHGNARPAAALTILIAVFAAACNAVLGPSEPDHNWTSHDSPRFTLHARPGSFAAEQAGYLAVVLEDQYDTTLRMLGAQYGGRISGFLFASAAERDTEFDRTGSAYPATEAFAAVCVPPLDDGLLGLLAHEANHVVIWNALGRPGTSFMSEGLASAVLSEHYHQAGRHFLYSWTYANRGRLPAVSALVDDGQWPTSDSQAAYNAAASFLAYLLDANGHVPLRQLYYARPSEFTGRFREIYGRSVEDAEADWIRFAAAWTADHPRAMRGVRQ